MIYAYKTQDIASCKTLRGWPDALLHSAFGLVQECIWSSTAPLGNTTNMHEITVNYIQIIKDLGPAISDKIFSRFPYISLCKTCDPWGQPIFGIIWTNFVKVH